MSISVVCSVLEGGHARASDVPVHPADAGRHRALQVHHADGRRQLLRPAGRLEAGDRRDPTRDQGEGKGRIYLMIFQLTHQNHYLSGSIPSAVYCSMMVKTKDKFSQRMSSNPSVV